MKGTLTHRKKSSFSLVNKPFIDIQLQLYLILTNFKIFFLVSKAALVVPGAAESLQQRRRSFGTELEDSIAAFRNKNASDEAKL